MPSTAIDISMVLAQHLILLVWLWHNEMERYFISGRFWVEHIESQCPTVIMALWFKGNL